MKGNKDLVWDYDFNNPLSTKEDRKKLKELKQMKIKVEESIKLEDGKHSGEIEDVEYKSPKGYNYMDLVIKTKVKDKDVKIKASYPQNITENSALGQLLIRFGAKLDIGKDLEPEEFLTKGKEIEFQTITEGKYYNVVLESVKPK